MTAFQAIRATGIDPSRTVVHEPKRPARPQGNGDLVETFTFFVTLSGPPEDQWKETFFKRWKAEGRGGEVHFSEDGCIGVLSSIPQRDEDIRNVKRCVALTNDDHQLHLNRLATEAKRQEALKDSVAAWAKGVEFK